MEFPDVVSEQLSDSGAVMSDIIGMTWAHLERQLTTTMMGCILGFVVVL